MTSKRFSVWAPKAQSISLVTFAAEKTEYPKTEYPMHPCENGCFETTITCDSEVDYMFLINSHLLRADPMSNWQPQGVHGPSRTYDHDAFLWQDSHWQPLALNQYLIYELHIGTFTPEATFEAAISKLTHLKALGITAIELMPIVEFPGSRNWGYDGTYPYAPHHSYGGPEGLKKFINACHLLGIAVIIDVVYNHLGPEGNYLGDFGYYFTDQYKTPWGQAINYDGAYSDKVREYVINNALYWVDMFHADALRLDAIHTIFDMSATHILQELKLSLEKRAHIIAESDLNDVRVLNDREKGGYALDAQWSDDFHHSIHALVTGDRHSYFQDFGTVADLKKAYDTGFVYDGKYSSYRKKRFGSSSAGCTGDRFVVALQNHDQVGNATSGARLHTLMSEDQYRMVSMMLFLAPNIPLLFMGQEWAANSPFLYFTSFEDETLVQSVKEGYMNENYVQNDQVECNLQNPDLQNPDRFFRSKLNWQELEEPKHRAMLDYYQMLILLRKSTACLSNCNKELTQTWCNENNKWLIVMRSDAISDSRALLIANLSQTDQLIPLETKTPATYIVSDGNALSKEPWRLACHSSLILSKEVPQSFSSLKNIFVQSFSSLLYIREQEGEAAICDSKQT